MADPVARAPIGRNPKFVKLRRPAGGVDLYSSSPRGRGKPPEDKLDALRCWSCSPPRGCSRLQYS